MKSIAVRQLAEFVFRQGDLHASRNSRPVDAQEGIVTQQLIQNQRQQTSEAFEAEVSVALEADFTDGRKRLAGRIDGLVRSDNAPWRVEEYKATRDQDAVLNPIHWGQGLLYAALLVQQHRLDFVQLAVIYVHPESLQEQVFEKRIDGSWAMSCLALALLCFDVRQLRHRQRCKQRVQWMQQRGFPYPEYRGAQKAMAHQVYRSLVGGQHLLLEATTGAGKSVATLYPALKQMSADQRLFFLTNRSTGADAALSTATLISEQSGYLCAVQITAKEKVCINQGQPCQPQDCTRCKNYFSRAPYAVNQLLKMGVVNRAAVESVAAEFQVCPFELSLDTALWADVIIGDYNYVFDPFVKLQRFADSSKSLLLVDEAHQLSSRVTEMLGSELLLDLNRQGASKLGLEFEGARGKLYEAAKTLVGETKQSRSMAVEDPDVLERFDRAAAKLVQCVDELELFDDCDEQILALYFACYRWGRGLDWYKPERYSHLVDVGESSISVKRHCLDAADHIGSTLAAHAASVRFSATVSPLALYQRLHGRTDNAFERARSPFHPEQTAVWIVNDIPTYFRQRDKSLFKLSQLVEHFMAAGPGRYLIGFSSYAYLDAFSQQHRPKSHSYFFQRSGESEEAIDQHRRRLEQEGSTVFGVVMGGSFSESIEFLDAPLSGIIVVGLGLPPPSLQRDLTASYFDRNEGLGWGQMVAYHQPALAKVVQMAGRLLRSERDRGVICLVDERFQQPQIQSFLPAHWQTQTIGLNRLKQALQTFWSMT